MTPNTVLGILCVFYGIYIAYLHMKNPEKLGKLEAMEQRFGKKKARAIHIFGYAVMPLLAGIVLIVRGIFQQ